MDLSTLAAAKRTFDSEGYAIFKNVVSRPTLERAQAAYQRMLKKAETGQYPHFRIYDDLLQANIAGIEHIFHRDIFESDLFDAVVESGLLPISMAMLGTEAPVMLLNRIHCTTRYSHTGMWHRDASPGTQPHVQMALFLFDENDFMVIPSSHQRDLNAIEREAIARSSKALMPGECAIGGKAGDLMLFKSAILHRGRCVQQRASVHFRIGPGPEGAQVDAHRREWFNREVVIERCDQAWRTLFATTMRDGEDNALSARGIFDHTPRRVVKRLCGTALHHLLFMLPESHALFERFKWVTPNLRLRQRFELK